MKDLAHAPGWEEFVRVWLSRVVGFLMERRCSQRGNGHEGLHAHEDGKGVPGWYQAEASTGEEVQMDRDMDDLVGALERSEI